MDASLSLAIAAACMLVAWLIVYRRKPVSGKAPPVIQEGFGFWTGHISYLVSGAVPKDEIPTRLIDMVRECPHSVSAIYAMGPSWLTRPIYMVKDAELIATTLSQGERYHAFLRASREIIGEKSIPALRGTELKRHKKILTSSILLRKALARLTEIVSRNTDDHLTAMATAANDGDSSSSSFQLDLATSNALGLLVIDSLGSFAFGMDISRSASTGGADPRSLATLHDSLQLIFAVFRERITAGPLRILSYLAVFKNVRVRRAQAFIRREFILPAMERRKAAIAGDGAVEVPDDALTMMLLAGEESEDGFSDAEICDEAMLMIIGGFETTNSSLLWVLFHLAKHPEHQDLCFDEINDVMSKQAPGSLPALVDVDQFTYLHCVIQESMRLTPTAPIVTRHFADDFPLGDYVIPGGSSVNVVPIATSNSEDLFDRAADFLPSRWKDDPTGGAKLPGASFVPFGLGKLRCFGQPIAVCSMKAILATWIRRYRFELLSDAEPGVRFTIVMLPKSLRVRMIERR